MDFVTQFENTLEQTIRQGMFAEANQLVSAYPSTGQPYTLKLFSLINQLRQSNPTHLRRIVLFRTGNFILDYILEQFLIAFSAQEYETYVFDPSDYTKSTTNLFEFAREGIDAAYFFNNVGLLQTLEDGCNLWETLHVPCFDFLVDHPMYYADSLDHAPARTTLLCADLTHTEYAKRFYPRVQAAHFLPTGGCEANFETIPWSAREMDVLFIGSYKFHADYKEDTLDERIINHLIKHTDHTFEDAIESCLAENLTVSGEQLCDKSLKSAIEKHRFLETNLTARYRKVLIEELVTAGIDIHVYGNGWEQSGLTSYPNFHLHAPVSFEEGIALMSQTKILVNHMAWFKHGSSERIFNAMAQGAVCVTDSSSYLDEILQDGINCRLYSLPEIISAEGNQTADGATDAKPQRGIAGKISALLSDSDTAAKIAAEGQKTASLHTWQKHLLYAIIDS